jgi:hypothetical protein
MTTSGILLKMHESAQANGISNGEFAATLPDGELHQPPFGRHIASHVEGEF